MRRPIALIPCEDASARTGFAATASTSVLTKGLTNPDTLEGRAPHAARAIADPVHAALVAAFRIPETDQFQVLTERPGSTIVLSSRSSRSAAGAKRRNSDSPPISPSGLKPAAWLEDRTLTEPQDFRVEDRIGLASLMTSGR
jgi:hypothetical protein